MTDAQAGPAAPPGASGEQPPLRVTTLEIFFDLVFAFTLTQLTSVLATRLSWLTVLQVLLVFGLLWWMYGAYAWLTNSRPPVHTAERLPLLAGMAGFLVVGLAIPRGFSSYGLVLGLGYLVVVVVHAVLYYRVNANILRATPRRRGARAGGGGGTLVDRIRHRRRGAIGAGAQRGLERTAHRAGPPGALLRVHSAAARPDRCGGRGVQRGR
jgi:Bacterial low temperature requirement A protein (LtrA)